MVFLPDLGWLPSVCVSQPTLALPWGICVSSPKAPPGLFHVAEDPATVMVMQSLAELGSLLQPLLERQPSWEELSSGSEPAALVSSTRAGGGHHI